MFYKYAYQDGLCAFEMEKFGLTEDVRIPKILNVFEQAGVPIEIQAIDIFTKVKKECNIIIFREQDIVKGVLRGNICEFSWAYLFDLSHFFESSCFSILKV